MVLPGGPTHTVFGVAHVGANCGPNCPVPRHCLDTASCDAHCMWHHDMEYAVMPPALRCNLNVPWDLYMEEYLKVWWNSTYTTWKTGFPGEEVTLAMTFISTSHREFDSGQLMLDISDGGAIWYPASKVDDEDDDSDKLTGDAVEDDDDEDDSDDDDLDGDLHRNCQ